MSTFLGVGATIAGKSGPLIVLTGEVDITTAAELSGLVTSQLAEGTLHLTIDVGGLDFAICEASGCSCCRQEATGPRGERLVLLRPQRTLARVLDILGAEEVIEIQKETRPRPSRSRERQPRAAAKCSNRTDQH